MERFEIGAVARPQGIHGEVKLELFTSSPEDFLYPGATVYLCGAKGEVEYAVTAARSSDGVVKLSGIDDRNAAELLRGSSVFADRPQKNRLSEGEYYIVDLIGCKVLTDRGGELGTLTDIRQYGSADVYHVSGKDELSFPALKRLLLKVDIGEKTITVSETALAEVCIYEDKHTDVIS